MFINIKKNTGNIKKYQIFINDKFIKTSTNGKINIDLSKVNGLKKDNRLRINAFDSYDNYNEKTIIFKIK